MNEYPHKVILGQMAPKERLTAWPQKHTDKRLLRNTAFFAAVYLCLGLCAWFFTSEAKHTEAVMSHLTANFEYDETLGRLQLVNNILPQSAMVFLNTSHDTLEFFTPVQAQISHGWTQQEPWFEYAAFGDVSACQEGEIMTVIQNHTGSSTVRILHDNGYESIYSGLHTVHAREHERVFSGQIIGTSVGKTAFELRKDGVSVLPAFSEI